jgi:ZIP family zinc transporter
MNIYSILFSIIVFFTTIGGGLFAIKYRSRLGIIEAFVAGVLLAIALFELIPESFDMANKPEINMPIKSVMYIVAIGFIFLYILERYISIHRICIKGKCENVKDPKGGSLVAMELVISNFIDGLAIGLGFQVNLTVGVIVGIAMIGDNFCDGINTATIMMNHENTSKSSMRMVFLDAITPILGALSVSFFTISDKYLVLVLPFLAGGLIYLGASDLIPEAYEKIPPLTAIVWSILGFIFMFLIVTVAG